MGIVRAAFCVAASCLIAACGTAAGESSPGQSGLTSARIAVFAGVEQIPWLATVRLAEQKGFYRKAGLDVDITVAAGGGDTIRLVAGGQADIAIAGPDATYSAASDPANALRITGAWHNHLDQVWVGTKEAGAEGGSMAISSAGSLGELLLKAVEGKRPGTTFEKVAVGALGTQWAAARAGKVDGAMTAPPLLYVQQQQGGKVILEPRDVLGDVPGDLVSASEQYITETDGEGVRKFLTAMDATFRYVREHPQAAAQELGELTDTPAQLVRRSFEETPNFEEVYSMKVDCEAMRNLSSALEAAGTIDEPIDWSEAIDQRYLAKANRCAEFE